MVQRRNLRRHERELLNARVRVSWQDAYSQGSFREAQARLIDISDSGMRIEVAEAIPARSSVTLVAEAHRLRVSASCRYCRRMGTKYTVGLEYVGRERWFRPVQTLG